MKIIVLAAGVGSRLMPFTENCPKTLVPLNGTPLLEYQLRVFNSLGLTDITIVAGYLSESFNQYPVNVVYNHEFKSSNMLHSLMCAKQLMLEGEDIIIAYGDIIYERCVLEQLIEQKGDVVISADTHWLDLWKQRMENPIEDAESFKFLPDSNQLLELGKKIESVEDAQAQYIGLIKFRASALKRIIEVYLELGSDITKNMYLTDFIQHLINQGVDVISSLHSRGWLEVDTVEDLKCYQELIEQNRIDLLGYKPTYG